MGGRLADWLGQDVAANRPAAAGVAALTQPFACVLYFANDTKILSIYDHTGPSWFDLDIASLSSVAFLTMPDVDVTGLANGDVFRYDLASGNMVPYTIPALPTAEEIQDLVGAMGANGIGTTFAYDDVGGLFTFDCTITQYTDELAQDAVAAAYAAGTHTGITVNYDDGGNSFSFDVSPEFIRDTMATAFAAGTHVGVIVTHDDGSDLFNVEIVEATAADLWAGTADDKVVTPKTIKDASEPQAVAYAATIALDLDDGFNFDIGDLTGDLLLDDPTNGFEGQSGVIFLKQDGTGGHTVTYGSDWRFPGGALAIPVDEGISAETVITYVIHSGLVYATVSPAFGA